MFMKKQQGSNGNDKRTVNERLSLKCHVVMNIKVVAGVMLGKLNRYFITLIRGIQSEMYCLVSFTNCLLYN